MRAIRIDPWARSVEDLELDEDEDGGVDYGSLRRAVFPGRQYALGYLDHAIIQPGLAAFVDDEGHAIPWLQQQYVRIHPPHRPDLDGRTLAGQVILLGMDAWGNTHALPDGIDCEMVRAMVRWADVREMAPV